MTRAVQACIWQGTDLPGYSANAYSALYVERLARGVERHVSGGELQLLADPHFLPKVAHVPGMTVHPFYGMGVGGWSNMLEAFRPDLWPAEGDRNVLVGLDTVLTGDCSWLFEWDESPVGLPLDPYRDPIPCDAVVSYSREGAEIVWNEFGAARETKMAKYRYGGHPSEMVLLRELYKRHGWKPLEPVAKRLLSYKAHWSGGPLPSIVYFHGKPKPSDLPAEDLIRQIWES